ncbi:sodium:proline symporter [Chryseobacterium indologenes]|uniref:Sodium/proline symporter n=1 Tax=Chryseobacterium indologenes TaxID=253 RepID=A0A411DSX7_CHRID|nr:sodium:proline symporter [Chryseobacterium indologenes]
MQVYEGISVGLYLLLMIGIGIYSYRKSTSNSEEFLIGGRKMGAAVTALSAGAADMSGWLLMGVPGAMYLSGISSSWIAIGLTIGAYLNYIIVAPRLRIYTEVAQNAITLPVFFENRFKNKNQLLKITSSIFILVFFTLYTSAGMVSGGKLFESAFGMDYTAGLLLTSLVVSLIEAKNPKYLDLFRGTTTVSIISLLAWGLGYCGQPHILVRFMAIDKPKDLIKARRIGITWMIFTVAGALAIGLVGIAYLQKFDMNTMMKFDGSKTEAETIFIYFSRILFHPFIAGFLLTAILAAVMSTISSQLLVTSSSLTEDIYKAFLNKKATPKQLLIASRLSVLLVAVIAVLLSLDPKDSILNLVGNAWAGFGSAFGPLILLSLLWKKATWQGGFAGMMVGGITVLAWVYLQHPLKDWYEIIPGFVLSLLTNVIVSLLTYKPDSVIESEFHEVQKIMQE